MTIAGCRHCGEKIETARASWQVARGTYRDDSGFKTAWFHVGGDLACATGGTLADPAPHCPRCESVNYVHDASDAWADYSRCADCGHTDRRPLGD